MDAMDASLVLRGTYYCVLRRGQREIQSGLLQILSSEVAVSRKANMWLTPITRHNTADPWKRQRVNKSKAFKPIQKSTSFL